MTKIKIIYRIAFFILLVIISDQVIGFFLQKLYFNQRAGTLSSLTFTLRDCKADVLIFGSSQAQSNYDPRIISDSLNMSCYNSGQGGGHSILLTYAQIKVISSRYKPKIIVIDLGTMEALQCNSTDYERLSILEPYCTIYPELKEIVLLKGPKEKIKLLSAIYPFNSKIINMLRFNTNLDKNNQWMFNGYIPIRNKILDITKLPTNKSETSFKPIDPNKLNVFKKIIALCKSQNIKLFFSISPIFHSSTKNFKEISESQKIIEQILHQENIPLINMEEYKYFQDNHSYFADQAHLNENGATKFSELICKFLNIDSILTKH